MLEAAREELRGWGGSWVSLEREGDLRARLLLRLEGVSPVGAETTVLDFGRVGAWWVRQVENVEVAPHLVVFDHGAGARTQVARMVLPRAVERALHVGQFSTRELELPTIPTPFFRSHVPALSRSRPKDVVVWTEFACFSRLALWWVCASFPQARIWVVPVPLGQPRNKENWCHCQPGDLMRAAPRLQRLGARQVSRFAANWRAWHRGEPDWTSVALPRWPEEDRWVGEVPGPLFEVARRASTSGRRQNPFTESEYRLTEEGRGLLERLPSLGAAPPFEIGSFRFYAPDSWLLTPSGVTRSRA